MAIQVFADVVALNREDAAKVGGFEIFDDLGNDFQEAAAVPAVL